MGLGRDALLWASGNTWLRERLPRLRFVRYAVLKFMPGETLDAALEASRHFAERGLPTTLTHLGENIVTEEEAEAVAGDYLEVLDRVAGTELDTEISVKLTHLGYDLDPELAAGNLERLIERAGRLGNWVWVDMESSAYVEGTLDIYRRALRSNPQVGLCLQAYLHRTADDLASLLPLRPSIRLVKGAYREPEEVAITKKAEIDRSFLLLSERILDERRQGRIGRFAVATHDLKLIDRIDAKARSDGLDRDSYEIQMLYGIRQADQFRLAGEGRPTRSLVAYGPAWYPWYMRRLAERPANVWFALRNLFARRPLARAP
jgi:proline dehydrogenase